MMAWLRSSDYRLSRIMDDYSHDDAGTLFLEDPEATGTEIVVYQAIWR